MKNYTLLVFDWDGTLIDSAGLAIEAIKKAAADLGHPIPLTSIIHHHFGLSLEEIQKQLFPKENFSVFAESFYKFFSEEKLASYFFKNTLETLHHLKQKGFVLAIATNKPRAKLDLALETSKLKNLFSATRCPEDCAPKPQPHMLFSLLEELEHESHKTLMIGDTTFDMQFAQNAKVDALAACYGHHKKEQLAKFNPIGFIDDIKEIKFFLKNSPIT